MLLKTNSFNYEINTHLLKNNHFTKIVKALILFYLYPNMIQIADIKRTTYIENGVPFEMVTVEKRAKEEGEYDFIMGDDESSYDYEKPAHPVAFKNDFEIGKYPVTQAIWEAVMGKDNNPSHFKGTNRPVEQVSWNDIQIGDKEKGIAAFLDKLNAIQKIKAKNLAEGKQFRLPTEAQWEYAAHGGKYWKELNYKYAGSNQLKEVGWDWKNSHRGTKPVGLKMPNVLGLCDMSGNVWEWCEDSWHENYKGAPEDGTVWLSEKDEDIRVVRGGSWLLSDEDCLVVGRNTANSDERGDFVGFRLFRY